MVEGTSQPLPGPSGDPHLRRVKAEASSPGGERDPCGQVDGGEKAERGPCSQSGGFLDVLSVDWTPRMDQMGGAVLGGGCSGAPRAGAGLGQWAFTEGTQERQDVASLPTYEKQEARPLWCEPVGLAG